MIKNKRDSRIAILGTLPPIKAISSYCFEFTKSLTTLCDLAFISFKEIYPTFLYPGGKNQADFTFPEIKNPNLEIRRRLTWYNPFSWLREGLFTKGMLLHVQWWSLPLFPIFFVICLCFKLRSKPIVFTVHNVLPHEKSYWFLKASSVLFHTADHFIVHSKTCRRQMMESYRIPGNRISIIAHGSLDFHKKTSVNVPFLRKEMGFSPEENIILLFGSIRPYKGVDIALKALPQIIKEVPYTRLLIAGKPWEDWTPYQKLIDSLEIQNHVSTHLEYIPSGEVYKFFEICDMALFPYRNFDSQSGAGATAVSFRKPLVVTNVGGLPELVPHGRFVAPPNNPHAIARIAVRLLQDPQMKNNFFREADLVSKRFDWAEIALKTLRVYKNLLPELANYRMRKTCDHDVS